MVNWKYLFRKPEDMIDVIALVMIVGGIAMTILGIVMIVSTR